MCERTAKNDLEFKIKALKSSLKEEKIKFHKLKFGEDSMPNDAELGDVNEDSKYLVRFFLGFSF